jgi:hypothetical protein
VEMVLYEALGWQQAELTAWVETMGTPTPPPQQQPRPPPPPPAVDALHRDCIREKFAAAVDCDKSFLEDYAVFLAARSAVSPPERRPRDHVRENASAHPGARAAARRNAAREQNRSVLASARAIGWRTPPRKPAREWRVTSRSPERAPRPPRPPSFLDAKRAREPGPCPRTPSPRPRRSPSEVHVDARLALLDEITRPETSPPAPEPQSTGLTAADSGRPSTSAASANTNAALRALLKQKDAQIAALKAQLVGPAPRRPPVPQTTPPKTPSGDVSIARQSPRKRHGALLGQIRDILHLAHAPRHAGAAAPAPADAVVA